MIFCQKCCIIGVYLEKYTENSAQYAGKGRKKKMQHAKSVICIVIMSILFSFSVFAAEECKPVKICIDSNELSLECEPIISDSRTLAPIRPVAEACGITVGWNADRGEVTLSCGFITAFFKEGAADMTVYNSVIDELSTVTLEAAPININSTMYVALRPMLEIFGADIQWDAENRIISVISPEKAIAQKSESDANKDVKDEITDAPKKAVCKYTGFRDMKDNTITESAPHGLYGRILTNAPITSVRCRIVDTDMDYILFFKKSDNITNYNVFTYFDRLICFSDAGHGPQTFEVYVSTNGNDEELLFCYEYTVIPKDIPVQEPAEDEPSEDYEETVNTPDADEDTEAFATIGYYGFRKMNGDRIIAGAPHGLYGNVVSSSPITSVRCRISGTDMDYTETFTEDENITEYNVFTFFDPIICFSDAGEGAHTFEIYASAANDVEQHIFSYSYTVITASQSSVQNNSAQTDNIPSEYDVCLPLEGTIKVTSPYGFRAYNKWEFHKGVDIISDSLAILSVADGVVIDCATGRNSGVGNYVIIEHKGGWVSLYYHLASYDVEIGDKVKKGQRFATMGNSGGNYGTHLHFMTCDKWYGSIWATQNNHHKPPHEYVPQFLTDVMFYNPSFEKVNTDKMILCTFRFPGIIAKGSAFSISSSKPFVASENPLRKITLTITDEQGNVIMSKSMENPEYTTSELYTYTYITAAFDMMCEFDKLPVGKMKVQITTISELGRERTVYEKSFEVTENPDSDTDSEAEAVITPEEAAKTDAFESVDDEEMPEQ